MRVHGDAIAVQLAVQAGPHRWADALQCGARIHNADRDTLRARAAQAVAHGHGQLHPGNAAADHSDCGLRRACRHLGHKRIPLRGEAVQGLRGHCVGGKAGQIWHGGCHADIDR